MPSYRELAELLGYRSKNSVFKLIQKLRDDGFLDQDDQKRLIPRQLFGAVKILGTVEAGFPTGADEDDSESVSLDQFLIRHKEATYMLKVRGKSMIDAGIHPGDMVLVERDKTPRDGDIVIAHIDNEWTMKYYRKKGSRVYLQAANRNFPDIFPHQELKIPAVVVAVVRKY